MKTETRIAWMMATLLLWLAAAPLAQAFYNPNSGRWLNRDPIEERGGLNLVCFAHNSPIQSFDALGKACPAMDIRDLGFRDSVTNRAGTKIQNGNTTPTSWVMSAITEKCFPFFSTCKYKARIRACWSSVEYWYDTNDTREHELVHVAHFENNWNALLSVVEPLVDRCVSQRKAACYQNAIELYSDYFYEDAWASGYELDCSLYSESCAEATDARRRADDLSKRANETLQRCELLP